MVGGLWQGLGALGPEPLGRGLFTLGPKGPWPGRVLALVGAGFVGLGPWPGGPLARGAGGGLVWDLFARGKALDSGGPWLGGGPWRGGPGTLAQPLALGPGGPLAWPCPVAPAGPWGGGPLACGPLAQGQSLGPGGGGGLGPGGAWPGGPWRGVPWPGGPWPRGPLARQPLGPGAGRGPESHEIEQSLPGPPRQPPGPGIQPPGARGPRAGGAGKP